MKISRRNFITKLGVLGILTIAPVPKFTPFCFNDEDEDEDCNMSYEELYSIGQEAMGKILSGVRERVINRSSI